jgi:hypothetical protein
LGVLVKEEEAEYLLGWGEGRSPSWKEGTVPWDVRSQDKKELEKRVEEGKLEEKKSFKDIVKSRPERKGEDVEMGGVSMGQNDAG